MITNSSPASTYLLSSAASTLAGAPPRSQSLHSRGEQMRDLQLQPARNANFVILIRVEASFLAWILEQGVVDATGYVVVTADADARTALPAVLPEPVPARADVPGGAALRHSQRERKLHAEPLG